MIKLERNDIIELEDNKEYVIAEMYQEENNEYLMLLEMEDDDVTENIMYAKVVDDGIEKLSLEEEKDISEIFIPLFEQNYVNE